MTVIDAYQLSLYSDDSLFVRDCNAWVTPVISSNKPAFIAYVEDTDAKKYTWHHFFYKRGEDGIWERQTISRTVYEVLRSRWVINPQWVIYPQEIRY